MNNIQAYSRWNINSGTIRKLYYLLHFFLHITVEMRTSGRVNKTSMQINNMNSVEIWYLWYGAMHRIIDTNLFYILNDTGNEFTNYKWLCGNRPRITDSRNRHLVEINKWINIIDNMSFINFFININCGFELN